MEKSCRCSVCANLEGRFCTIKKITLKPNNKRRCPNFDYDETKVKIHQAVPTIDMTGGYAIEQKRLRKQAREYIAKQQSMTSSANWSDNTLTVSANPGPSGDFTKPDCLANFRSSATE